MNRVEKLEKQIDKAVENEDWELYCELMDKLRYIDPFNEVFHLGCLNWPNCELEGCGDGK